MAVVIDSENFRSRAAALQTTGGEGGGKMDDVLKRLGILETIVNEVRVDVSAIKATLPHLATKADLKEAFGSLESKIAGTQGSLEAKMHGMETRLIQWFIGTAITLVALAFGIAKYVPVTVHSGARGTEASPVHSGIAAPTGETTLSPSATPSSLTFTR
jgi:hypothetical protein